jgi:hypothetical protein
MLHGGDGNGINFPCLDMKLAKNVKSGVKSQKLGTDVIHLVLMLRSSIQTNVSTLSITDLSSDAFAHILFGARFVII